MSVLAGAGLSGKVTSACHPCGSLTVLPAFSRLIIFVQHYHISLLLYLTPMSRPKAIRFAAQVIPLEMLPAGEFDLVYRSPLDPRSGELPVLPLSISGALAMAKPEDPAAAADGYVAADQVRRHDVLAPSMPSQELF